MADHSLPSARRLPVLLLLALLLKAAWMGWIWWYGSLPYTSDSVCFKQPAYMRLHTPEFSIPSYAGRGPSIEKLNSYPAALYVYANYASFRLFGFGVYSSIAVDLLIHLTLSAVGSWAIWRLTTRQLPALLFLGCSSEWLLLAGRPEELGMLFVLLGLLALPRGNRGLWCAIVGLGLAGATSPGAAVVGTMLLIAFDGFSHGFQGAFWRRAAMLLVVPIMLSGAIYIGYVWPDVIEAWQQDRALRADGLYTTIPLRMLLKQSPWWAFSMLVPALGTVALTLYSCSRRPTWFPLDQPSGAFVSAAAVAITVGLVLNVTAQRLEYDYRHVFALGIASIAIVVSWWQTNEGRYTPMAWTLAFGLVLVGLPMQRGIVRHTLAPLAWGDDAIDHERARQIVRELVPPTATVGGDGAVWTLIDDGRPFLLTRTISEDRWPEYIITGNWSRPPIVQQDVSSTTKLATEYEEITPNRRPNDGCSLDLGALRVPIATGHCDWYLRIWKRRAK